MGHKNKGKAKKRSKARDKNGMETVSSAVLETLGGSEHDIASPAELINDMSGAPDLTRGRLRKKLYEAELMALEDGNEENIRIVQSGQIPEEYALQMKHWPKTIDDQLVKIKVRGK